MRRTREQPRWAAWWSETRPKRMATGPRSSASTRRPRGHVVGVGPGGDALAARGRAQDDVAGQRRIVEGDDRDAGLHHREDQRVGDAVAGVELAVHEALDRHLLDRRAIDVGVEADLAEEDAVGARHRAGAQRDRVGAAEAVADVLQPLAQRARRAAGDAIDRRDAQPQARQLGDELGGDDAVDRVVARITSWAAARRRAPARRSRPASFPALAASPSAFSSPKVVPVTRPPWRANVSCGQTCTW